MNGLANLHALGAALDTSSRMGWFVRPAETSLAIEIMWHEWLAQSMVADITGEGENVTRVTGAPSDRGRTCSLIDGDEAFPGVQAIINHCSWSGVKQTPKSPMWGHTRYLSMYLQYTRPLPSACVLTSGQRALKHLCKQVPRYGSKVPYPPYRTHWHRHGTLEPWSPALSTVSQASPSLSDGGNPRQICMLRLRRPLFSHVSTGPATNHSTRRPDLGPAPIKSLAISNPFSGGCERSKKSRLSTCTSDVSLSLVAALGPTTSAASVPVPVPNALALLLCPCPHAPCPSNPLFASQSQLAHPVQPVHPSTQPITTTTTTTTTTNTNRCATTTTTTPRPSLPIHIRPILLSSLSAFFILRHSLSTSPLPSPPLFLTIIIVLFPEPSFSRNCVSVCLEYRPRPSRPSCVSRFRSTFSLSIRERERDRERDRDQESAEIETLRKRETTTVRHLDLFNAAFSPHHPAGAIRAGLLGFCTRLHLR
ncbi:hypothetical protein CHU98_g11177 [Xylaria longipes]|nr:hypothetical protein CHU98_g11177 [Xylaria longipes]